MGGITVCDKVCLGVEPTSSFLACGKSQSSLVDKILGRGYVTTEFFCLWSGTGTQRRALPAGVYSSKQHSKVAYSGLAHSATLHYVGFIFS